MPFRAPFLIKNLDKVNDRPVQKVSKQRAPAGRSATGLNLNERLSFGLTTPYVNHYKISGDETLLWPKAEQSFENKQ